MRQQLLAFSDRLLLRKRALIETIVDQLKNISQIEHSRHRSPFNFLVHLLAGLAAYCHQPKKPSLDLAAHPTHRRPYPKLTFSTKAISSLERGVNRYPRRDTLQLLSGALELDEEQRGLLAVSCAASTAGAVSLTSFHTYRAADTGAVFQGHIAHLRTSKQHMLLVDALLVRAMIAVHENACRAAMKDLDEAIALAQVLPDPGAELKALLRRRPDLCCDGRMCKSVRGIHACACHL